VVATEFGGFPPPPAPYGPTIVKYLESKGISWIVWCFDPEWGPTLVSDWNYTLNPSGEFVKQAMNTGWCRSGQHVWSGQRLGVVFRMRARPGDGFVARPDSQSHAIGEFARLDLPAPLGIAFQHS